MIIRENIPISSLTTMRIGGIARFVFEIENFDDVSKIIPELKARNISKYYFLGLGANTFAVDEGFDGAIILNKIEGIETEKVDENHVKFIVAGGVKWDEFVDVTISENCTGVECLAGIPGTVGAAPVQNIGAYGQEVSTSISKIHVLNMKTGETEELAASDCDFSYRHSIFNASAENREKYFIFKVEFILKIGEIEGELYNSLQRYLDENNITSRAPKVLADAVRKVRDSKLPDPAKIASSGSFFKNIYVEENEVADLDARGIPHHGTKVNTAWLIEKSDLKGKVFHGFKISETAPLVLINESGKTYKDLEKAVAEISNIVEEKFGFKLKQEPNVIGK